MSLPTVHQRLSAGCKTLNTRMLPRIQNCPTFKRSPLRRQLCYICRSVGGGLEPSVPAAQRAARVPVFQLISACVEVNALVQNYEVFAGRSAMIGIAVATLAECLTDEGVFQSVSVDQAAFFGSILMASVAVAAGLAALPSPGFGSSIQEAVISSLTAAKRSAGSVTQKQVDKAVDYLFDNAFDFGTLYRLLDDDLV